MSEPEKAIIKVWRLGLTSYNTACKIQEAIQNKHIAAMVKGKKDNYDTLLLVEHKPVYTAGARDKTPSQEIVTLTNLGAQFYKTNRGGLLTFHGLGQLVAYPIINLKHFKTSVLWHIKSLEETIIKLCADFDIEARRHDYPGVWVNDSKISEIGIHASRYVTAHGVSLNCNTDLAWFYYINPTGTEDDKDYTSLSKELGTEITIADIIPLFLKNFQSVYSCQFVDVDKEFKEEILKEVYTDLMAEADDGIDWNDIKKIVKKTHTPQTTNWTYLRGQNRITKFDNIS